MERDDGQATAHQVIRDAQAFATDARHLGELYEALVRGVAGPAIDEAVKARLPDAEYQRYLTDPQRPMLHLLLCQAAAAGHEIAEVLDQVTQQGYQGARSIAAVLHGRVERLNLQGGRIRRSASPRPQPSWSLSPSQGTTAAAVGEDLLQPRSHAGEPAVMPGERASEIRVLAVVDTLPLSVQRG